jgi:1-Cys peroxiredoxin 6
LNVKTTVGDFNLLDFKGKGWLYLFSHPRDFTPVCTTELQQVVKLSPEFKKRDCKIIGLSCDSIEDHLKWQKDILSYGGCSDLNSFPFPMIDDSNRSLATRLGLVDGEESQAVGLPLSCRGMFFVGPDNLLKMYAFYPATTGRSYDEVLRILDSLQMTNKGLPIATPADWTVGRDIMITPAASEEQARAIDPNYKVVGVPSGKKYLKIAQQPK